MYKALIKYKIGYIIPLAFSLFFSLLLVVGGGKPALIVLALIFTAAIIPKLILDARFAFFFIFIWASLLFFVGRLMTVDLPIGMSIELLFAVSLFGVFYQNARYKSLNSLHLNIVYWIIVIWILYNIAGIINPEAYFSGWINGLRGVFLFAEVCILGNYAVKNLADIKDFTKVWMIVLVVASIYCFYQDIIGLPSFDLHWVMAEEKRAKLFYQFGRWRLWSIFSDPTTFGLFSAYGSVFCLVLITIPISIRKRFLLLPLIIIFLFATVLTGTRTAYIIIPIGLIFYFIMTLRNPRTLFLIIISTMSLLIIIYGPFYGNIAMRVRSAFFPTEDASYQVREINRSRIRPYMLSHPFGGGMGTVGATGREFAPYHFLAGFPPDSYYLKTALENGYIGLIIILSLQIVVLFRAIDVYFNLEDRKIRGLLLAYLSSFVALSIAGYAQEAINQFPNNLLFIVTFVIVEKFRTFYYKT